MGKLEELLGWEFKYNQVELWYVPKLLSHFFGAPFSHE
jgi:hypothetical protein